MKISKEILINTPPVCVFAALLIPLRIIQWRKGFTGSTFDYLTYVNGNYIKLEFTETHQLKNKSKKINTELLDIMASSYLSVRYRERGTELLIDYHLTPSGHRTQLLVEQTLFNSSWFFNIGNRKCLRDIMITDDDLAELKEYSERTLFFPFPGKVKESVN